MKRFVRRDTMRTAASSIRTQLTVCVVDAFPQDYAPLVAENVGEGIRFQFATTGADALKLRRTASRSIWLVNIHLPDGSGCELAAAIRARHPHSVVYLVGDKYDPSEELTARRTSGAMYVCKPADPDWLPDANMPIHRLSRCAYPAAGRKRSCIALETTSDTCDL